MYFGFKPYVSVAERRSNAEKGRGNLEKKLGRPLNPVQSKGRKLALQWWGIAWNKNLESYSDYANRLPRGRSYLGNGSVLDLHIEAGKIFGMVQGSDTSPYEIKIEISQLHDKVLKNLVSACKGKLQDVRELLEGKFPQELGSQFLSKGTGLFPSNKEIRIKCDCPDYAELCKHAAASMYGVGVLLDSQPELLFALRGIDLDDFVGDLVQSETKSMVQKAKIPSKQSGVLDLDDSSLSALFGLDVVSEPAVAKKPAKKQIKKIIFKATKKVVKKAVKKIVKKVAKKAVKKTVAKPKVKS
jgi:uncharacterized Zn finger protein